MGKIRRFALTLGLTLAAGVSAGPAHAAPDDDDKAASSTSKAAASSAAEQTPEEKLAKRRERLQQGAQRLRDRAAEMRKKAAAGETPKSNPNAKRPPRSFEEQAQRLEEQAAKMEDRAKNLTAADVAGPSSDRAASSRKKRHQVRRVQLNRRWGDTLKDPEAIAELKLHAERAAKLKRIRTLALKRGKDDPVAERASKLLGQEVARHEKHMKELQAKSVAASVGSAAEGAAAPGTTTPASTSPGAAPEKEATP